MRVAEYDQAVRKAVQERDQRWGQAAWNTLVLNEIPGTDKLWGTLDDPFYRIKTKVSLRRWEAEHLVYDETGVEIVGVV